MLVTRPVEKDLCYFFFLVGKCTYNPDWERDDRFKLWVSAVGGNNKRARCRLCRNDFDVSNMGTAALISHIEGKKHKQCAESYGK